MDPQSCPLPEVASALGPFINPRDEVAAIRRNLQAYLQKQLPGDDETPLSAVNLTTPFEENLVEPPTALTGVRRAYWKALQANQTAQAKYDALKADLDALKRPATTPDALPASSSINETYIPLLRQKEKLRRLKVLEHAYSSLPVLPSTSESLEERLGPQPAPPSTHPPTSSSAASSGRPDVEGKLLELKKAVLKTRGRVQDQEARNAVAKASLPTGAGGEMGNGARIAGLQKALQELTGWMEEMLGVIADAEAETAQESSMPPTPAANGMTSRKPGCRVDLDEIETAYERYLLSRRRLVQSIASPPPNDEDETEPLFPNNSSPHTNATKHNNNTTTRLAPAELLLPHLPLLTSLKSHETTLLTQKAYIRAQLSSSEAETAKLVQRLAGESHLVGPGASRGEAWAEASREANVETERVVGKRVKVGEVSAAAAKGVLEGIEGVGR